MNEDSVRRVSVVPLSRLAQQSIELEPSWQKICFVTYHDHDYDHDHHHDLFVDRPVLGTQWYVGVHSIE